MELDGLEYPPSFSAGVGWVEEKQAARRNFFIARHRGGILEQIVVISWTFVEAIQLVRDAVEQIVAWCHRSWANLGGGQLLPIAVAKQITEEIMEVISGRVGFFEPSMTNSSWSWRAVGAGVT